MTGSSLLYRVLLFGCITAGILHSQVLRAPLLSVAPGMNATGVGRSDSVTITFASPMLPVSFNFSTVFLYGNRSGRHSIAPVYDQTNRKLTVGSAKKFIYGEELQFILTDSVGSADPYKPIAGGFGYNFVTGVLQGTGQFSVQSKQIPSASSPYAAASGDFNNDGYTDCAVTQKNSGEVSVYINNKRNGFFPPVNYTVGSSPEAIAVADLSRDGNLDIIVANRTSKSISILVNNGNGSFTVQQFLIGNEPVALAAADCNNDGFPDIGIVTSTDSSFHLYTYNNNTLQLLRTVTLSGIPSGLILKDLNNDGIIDGAVSVRSTNKLVLLKNDSLGHIAYDTAYTVGSSPETVIAYDGVLVPDGYVDLATVNSGSNNISIFKNNLNSRFQGPEHFDVGGTEPIAVCGNDFDGDGDVDLAISCRTSNSVVIFRNNGNGLPDSYAVPIAASPQGITALDITGEYGIMDLVVCNPQTGALSILRNGFVLPPAPKLYTEIDSVRFNPTALHDTNSVDVKVYASITPVQIDSVKFSHGYFFADNIFPVSVASYDSSTIRVKYIPQQYGTHRDTMTIFSDGGNRSLVVGGESPIPLLIKSADQIQFGAVKLKDTAVAIIVFRNSSVNSINIDSIFTKLPIFSSSVKTFPVLMHQNDSLVVALRFIPQAVGNFSDSLIVRYTPSLSNIKIPLFGKGDPSVGVNDKTEKIPSEFSLEQNFPNPFNPKTTINYQLPVTGNIRITIFNVVGQEIATLFDGMRMPGKYSVSFDGSALTSGIYFYRLTAKNYTETKKLMLLK